MGDLLAHFWERTCFALNWPKLAWCKDIWNVYTMYAVKLICTIFLLFLSVYFYLNECTFDIFDKPIINFLHFSPKCTNCARVYKPYRSFSLLWNDLFFLFPALVLALFVWGVISSWVFLNEGENNQHTIYGPHLFHWRNKF